MRKDHRLHLHVLAAGLVGIAACGPGDGGGGGSSTTSTGGTSSTGGNGGSTAATGGTTGGSAGSIGGSGGTGGSIGGSGGTGGTGGSIGGSGGTGGSIGGSGGTGGSTGSTTSMPCNSVFQGSFTIQNTLDVGAITPYCEITGDLTVDAAGLTTISLPNLRTLGGNFSVLSALTSLDLHALETVKTLKAHADQVDLTSLVSCSGLSDITTKSPVSLPAMTSFSDYLSITAKTSVSLPNLTTAGGLTVQAVDCAAGIAVSTPKLTTGLGYQVLCPSSVDVGSAISLSDVTIIRMGIGPTGVNVSFPVLTTARTFDVGTTGSVSAPNLVTVTTGDLRIKEWSGMSLPKLSTVGANVWLTNSPIANLDLPALKSIGGSLRLGGDVIGDCCANPPLYGNPNLVVLTLPSLTQVGAMNSGILNMGLNPKLPQCRWDALVAQLQQNGWVGLNYNAHPNLCTLAAGPCP